MLTWQLLKDIAGVATLGSANKKLDLTRWTRYLLPAEEIIAVLDNDTAGKLGAQNLAGLSAQIYPVRIPSLSPSGKDITDYVHAGGDLWEWLKHHLVRIETPHPF
jgi:DNA primase